MEPHGRYAIGRVLAPSVSQRESQVIESELAAAGPGATWKLVLDCRDVGMLSSVGLGMLITMHKKCIEGKGKFAIFGLSKDINNLLKITKLDKLILVASDEASAISKVGGK